MWWREQCSSTESSSGQRHNEAIYQTPISWLNILLLLCHTCTAVDQKKNQKQTRDLLLLVFFQARGSVTGRNVKWSSRADWRKGAQAFFLLQSNCRGFGFETIIASQQIVRERRGADLIRERAPDHESKTNAWQMQHALSVRGVQRDTEYESYVLTL